MNKGSDWTHREYFRRFRLNAEQYGEILIAETFAGIKKGDAQPCYDVETSSASVREKLQMAGAPTTTIEKCLSGLRDGIVRIEVKSKLAYTPGGNAQVIHCSERKIRGVPGHRPATHFAVVLFDGQGNGTAEHAWLFSSKIALSLRRKNTQSRYIPVPALKDAAREGKRAIIDIQGLVNEIATKSLVL
jgi:hypothetical protein